MVSASAIETWMHRRRRLRELEVAAQPIDPAQGTTLFRRFAAEFVDPARAGEMLLGQDDKALDFEHLLRPDCTRRVHGEGHLTWLRGGHADAPCVRFERVRELPALLLDTATMLDAWAGSWPGAFVNFERERALVVSFDYQTFRCDLRARRAMPYR